MNTPDITAANAVNEYTTYFQGAQKEFERTGNAQYLRRVTDDGDSFFLQITNGIKWYHVRNMIVQEEREVGMAEAGVLMTEGGWHRHG